MKTKIKAYFILLEYFLMIHRKFDKCQQGINSIQFYESQLRNYRCHVNLSKDDEDTISKFVKGLRADIKQRVLLQIVATYEFWDIIKIVLEVELQIKREKK